MLKGNERFLFTPSPGSASVAVNERFSKALVDFAALRQNENGYATLGTIVGMMSLFQTYDIISREKYITNALDQVDRYYELTLKHSKRLCDITKNGSAWLKGVEKVSSDYVAFMKGIEKYDGDDEYRIARSFVEDHGLSDLVDVERLRDAYLIAIRFIKIGSAFNNMDKVVRSAPERQVWTLNDKIGTVLADQLFSSFMDVLNSIRNDVIELKKVFFAGENERLHEAFLEIKMDLASLKAKTSAANEAKLKVDRINVVGLVRQDVKGMEQELEFKRKEKEMVEGQLESLDRKFGFILGPLRKPLEKYSYKNPSRVKELFQFMNAPSNVGDRNNFEEIKGQATLIDAALSSNGLGLKPKLAEKAREMVVVLKAMDYSEVDALRSSRERLRVLISEIGALEAKVEPMDRVAKEFNSEVSNFNNLVDECKELEKAVYEKLSINFGLNFKMD